MRKQLHTPIAWILLIMLFYNMGGYLIVFNLSETINRNSVNQLLTESGNDELLLLKISDSHAFTRIGDDEIIYQGKRYDIKNEFTRDGVNYFYCIHDNDEDNIYASLNTSVNNNSDAANEKQNSANNNFLKHIVKDYFISVSLKNNNDQFLNLIFYPENDLFQNNTCLNILTPPPEIFIS